MTDRNVGTDNGERLDWAAATVCILTVDATVRWQSSLLLFLTATHPMPRSKNETGAETSLPGAARLDQSTLPWISSDIYSRINSCVAPKGIVGAIILSVRCRYPLLRSGSYESLPATVSRFPCCIYSCSVPPQFPSHFCGVAPHFSCTRMHHCTWGEAQSNPKGSNCSGFGE